jgi:hypothetical protein
VATRLANRFAELSLHRSETLRRKGMSGLQVDRACKGPPGNGKVGRVKCRFDLANVLTASKYGARFMSRYYITEPQLPENLRRNRRY